MAGNSIALLKDRQDRLVLRLEGMIRRLEVTATESPDWQLDGGFEGAEGDRDLFEAPMYGVAGVYARPVGETDAILVNVGGQSGHPAVISVRDTATREAIDDALGGVAAGETVVYNAASVVVIRTDGTIEIRSKDGTALPLPTLKSLEALEQAFNAWVVVPNDGGAALKAMLGTLFSGSGTFSGNGAWPYATSKLRAE